VGRYGLGSLQQLASLVVVFWVSVAFFVLAVLGGVLRLTTGLGILRFLAYLREELTIVLATASSDAVLPQIMRKLERMGVRPSVVGLVVPTGYSFNLDAFSIYLTLAVVFIAHATNTPLSVGDLLLVLGISLVTSKGAHGVPGSAVVILAATLNAVPAIPAIGLMLMLSVDWFVGMARALGNLIGNCVATVVIGAWKKELDSGLASRCWRATSRWTSRRTTPGPRWRRRRPRSSPTAPDGEPRPSDAGAARARARLQVRRPRQRRAAAPAVSNLGVLAAAPPLAGQPGVRRRVARRKRFKPLLVDSRLFGGARLVPARLLPELVGSPVGTARAFPDQVGALAGAQFVVVVPRVGHAVLRRSLSVGWRPGHRSKARMGLWTRAEPYRLGKPPHQEGREGTTSACAEYVISDTARASGAR
jgi:hypothetical protein